MKLAFEIARSAGIIDRAIAWWTNGKYCHVEIWFDGLYPGQANSALCFSSRAPHGTAFKSVDLSNPTAWFIVPVNAALDQEKAAYKLALSLRGLKYGWDDILGFLIPPADPSRAKLAGQSKRFICSAVCTYICQSTCGMFEGNPPAETSPDLLADLTVAASKEVPIAK